MKQLVLLTLALVAVSEGFVLDPYGGFGAHGGSFVPSAFSYGGLYGGFPGLFAPPVHHHTVQPIIQPIIIKPPEEEEPPPEEPKVEVHVHHGPAEPHPPEPHPHPPEPQIHVIHV